MNKPPFLLQPEQQEVLAAWLPDDHEASLSSLTGLQERTRWAQQRPQSKDAFARLHALESAASAALWVLRRLPPGLHQKSQLGGVAPLKSPSTLRAPAVVAADEP